MSRQKKELGNGKIKQLKLSILRSRKKKKKSELSLRSLRDTIKRTNTYFLGVPEKAFL